MANPYELKPRVRWYHVLWDMRNKQFRKWYLRERKISMRMYWKYESHRMIQQVSLGLVAAVLFVTVCMSETARSVVRWPTDDVNELLKQPVWQKHLSAVNERKDQASKMLEDSNYVQAKNKPMQ